MNILKIVLDYFYSMSYFHSQDPAKWVKWKNVGLVDGSKFFEHSHINIKRLFQRKKKLFAKYNQENQTWYLTIINEGENRFPRVSWKYKSDNSGNTEQEILEWGNCYFCRLPIRRIKPPSVSINIYLAGFIHSKFLETFKNGDHPEQIIAQQNLKYYLGGL